MAYIAWNRPENRTYESGVDRGVLYVEGSVGVAWDGLTAVNESPTGGEATPYYLDGFKYLNVASSEEFEATIEAFSAPREFAPCDGISEIANGLFLTEQPRKSFGFSYRTRVGNALTHDAGYKIHLVYNALAAPSERANATISNEVEPTTRSWAITTSPPRLPGHKPTAHVVIDTRITPRGLLREIEDRLYGSDIHNPHLPTPAELVELFQSEGPVVAINLATNPSFETSAAAVEVRRNLYPNPTFTTAATIAPYSSASKAVAGGVATITLGAAPSALQAMLYPVALAGGSPFSARVQVRRKAGMTTSRVLRVLPASYRSGSGVAWGTMGSPVSRDVTLTDEWQEVEFSGFAQRDDANAVGLQFSTLGTWAVGEGFEIRHPLMEAAAIPGPYFDGGYSPDPDLTPAWVGTAGASESVLSGTLVSRFSLNPSGNANVFQSSHWASAGASSIRIVPTATSNITYAATTVGGFVEGRTYTIMVRVRLEQTQSGALHHRARSIYLLGSSNDYAQAPNEPGVHEIRFITTATKTVDTIVLNNGSATTDVWWDDLCIVEGNYEGPAFSGDTPDRDGYFYSWLGAPNNSQSELRTWH